MTESLSRSAQAFDPAAFRAEGDAYLLSCLRDLARPAPWRVLRRWAEETMVSCAWDDLDRRPASTRAEQAEELARAHRDQNIARHWAELHDLGFVVVDERGQVIPDEQQAMVSACIHLRRQRAPCFLAKERVGFFTHSVAGNALLLLLLAEDEKRLISPDGQSVSVPEISTQPNRHYLSNGHAVDLGSVVLIRHAKTEANVLGIALGRSDGDTGWRGHIIEDQRLVETPRGVGAWHRSSLVRTQQTARLFGVGDPTVHSTLDEMDIGVAEGASEQFVIGNYVAAHYMFVRGDAFAAIVDEAGSEPLRGAGECFVEVLLRTARCLRDLRLHSNVTQT